MPRITLPDGSKRDFAQPITVRAVAQSIAASLAQAALAGEVDGHLVDMAYLIDRDARVNIITGKDELGLEVIRHSTAHLLAHAVKTLFPTAQVTIGPVIENGFYYDFAYERPFTPEDLEKIEAKMAELGKANLPIERKALSREAAIDLFAKMGQFYKVEIVKAIPVNEVLTAYQQGDFIDLCRGPHVPSTGSLKAFKLTKLAGAYWRGDSNNEMLQRIYGTAWPDKESLNAYLHRLEEAEKRDHRLLAKKMDLFHLQPEAPGNIFWHPNGWQLVLTIREYIRHLTLGTGYQEVNTPLMVDSKLWELSGHKAKFGDEMFTSMSENREYMIKPMNCPCHVQIFKHNLRSYRDLPIRYAEFGHCHRNEPSGTLHGLMRVRSFVQDDGHIFCTEEQIYDEVSIFIDQVEKLYADFGFSHVIYRLSTRPEKRVGSDALWDKAEHMLERVLNEKHLKWDLQPGEGAFYGPKIEFSLKDCLDRVWQCGTMQVDFSTAERLGGYYIDEHGNKKPPVMLHRAILGSLERFVGVLLEHYAGKLPLWLAPIQAVVMNVTDRQIEFVNNVVENLQKWGYRVKSDLRNEKIGFKIREHTIARVPYLIVIGDREVAHHQVAVRSLEGADSLVLSLEELKEQWQDEIDHRR
ncbi:MAG: threonine--tRNA ligase [Coxiella sp. RIFCSPHIGHO2_12_FULL_42_15]|nr:MAG: threonine--tRNA ligase [Coxiella sp. RIFCSPHIGHO2_12_FULL_42_15]